MTSRRSWTWRAARLVVLCAAGLALMATSPRQTSFDAVAVVDVDVPAGQTTSLTVTVAGTAAAATQQSPVVPWRLWAYLDAETSTAEPRISAILSSGDQPIPGGDPHPDPCPPGQACVRRYRVLVAAPEDRPLRDSVIIRAYVDYDSAVGPQDQSVELGGDTPPDGAELALQVEGTGAPLVTDSDYRGWTEHLGPHPPVVLVTREQPTVEATVRRSFTRSSIPPSTLIGDRARLWIGIDMVDLAADEETAAAVSLRQPDGSPFADFESGNDEMQWGRVDALCDVSSCTVDLDLTARLEAGEWAEFRVGSFAAAPGDNAAPTSYGDYGIVDEGPPELLDWRAP